MVCATLIVYKCRYLRMNGEPNMGEGEPTMSSVEYLKIMLARCKDDKEAAELRRKIAVQEEVLLKLHNARVGIKNND